MYKIALAACAAFVLTTGGALAQTMGNGPTSSTQQHAPGSGGTSKPGVAGLPGSESGATKTPQGTVGGNPDEATTRQQDQSGVAGARGGKSGPAGASGR